MANINKELNDIKNAVYGKEVRGSIHDGIKKINEEVENTTDRQDSVEAQFQSVLDETTGKDVISAPEINAAKVGADNTNHPNLKTRLDTEYNQLSSQLAQTATKDELYRESNAKADKSYVDNKVNAVDDRINDIITTPAESVNEQEIIDAREGKDSLGKNIRDIRSLASTRLVNEVENGNFENGLEHFYVSRGTAEVVDGVVRLIGGSGRLGTHLGQIISPEVPTNEVWYVASRVRVEHDDCDWIGVGFAGSTGNNYTRLNAPDPGRWYMVSHVFDGNGMSGNFGTTVFSYWPSASERDLYSDFVIAINLTEAYGRGNEPTQEEVDKLIERFGYFEGDLGSGRVSNYLLENQQELLEKQQTLEESIERVKESELEDIITNGNFRENRDHWTSGAGTISNHIQGWIRISGVGSNATPRITQEIDTDYKKGDILYVSANFLPQNTDVTQIGFAIYSDNSTEADIAYLVITEFEHNQVTKVSGNITVASDVGNMRVQIRTRYPSAVASDGKAVDVTGIKVYNLTKFFGKGNEPTAEAFERMLSIMDVTERNKTDLSQTQKALTQYILERSKSSVGVLKRPLAVVSFDDHNLSDYEKAFPFLRARGIKGTVYVVTGSVGNSGKMDWNHLRELKNAGWDIGFHTHNHINLSNTSDSEIRADFEMGIQTFLDNGFPKPRHFAYPYGAGTNSDRVRNVLADYFKTARNSIGYSAGVNNTWEGIDFLRMNGLSVDMNEHRQDRLEKIKNMMKHSAENNEIVFLYAHKLVDSAPTNDNVPESIFSMWAELIDYAIDLDFEFLTTDEMYLRVLHSI